MPHIDATNRSAAADTDPGTTTDVIVTDALVKTYGRFRALDGLDLRVAPGEVHGFLGPNGAGKSTTIRILLGLIRASDGAATVLGADPWKDAIEIHRRVAFVPDDTTLWPGLTGGQCIDVLGRAHGGLVPERRARLIDRFDLDPTKRARDYSKGNRQKVALISALATDAELLILDEPTSGLDPLMERVFQDCVAERRAAGCTVLLSSHILGEVEALADRVSIVRRGQIVSSGSLADLRRMTRTTVQAVTYEQPDGIDKVPGVAEVISEHVGERYDTTLTVDAGHLHELVGRIHAAVIDTLTVRPPSLDELFLSEYEDEGRPT